MNNKNVLSAQITSKIGDMDFPPSEERMIEELTKAGIQVGPVMRAFLPTNFLHGEPDRYGGMEEVSIHEAWDMLKRRTNIIRVIGDPFK